MIQGRQKYYLPQRNKNIGTEQVFLSGYKDGQNWCLKKKKHKF